MENDSSVNLDFVSIINELVRLISSGTIEIYNEFSLQHELGIVLRNNLSKNWIVQFERNIGYFGIPSENLPKREIDIVAFDQNKKQKIAFELKYPNIPNKCLNVVMI